MKNLSITIFEKEIDKKLSNEVHKIHLSSLPNDVLPNFGSDFELRYLNLLLENNGYLIVAKKENTILGFIALKFGSLKIHSLLSFSSIVIFISKSFTKPTLIFKLIGQFNKKKVFPRSSAEVDYFAVVEEARGMGLGSLMLEEAEKICIKNNLHKVHTKTSNQRLIEYYKDKKGAKVQHEFKILRNRYVYLLWKIKTKENPK